MSRTDRGIAQRWHRFSVSDERSQALSIDARPGPPFALPALCRSGPFRSIDRSLSFSFSFPCPSPGPPEHFRASLPHHMKYTIHRLLLHSQLPQRQGSPPLPIHGVCGRCHVSRSTKQHGWLLLRRAAPASRILLATLTGLPNQIG